MSKLGLHIFFSTTRRIEVTRQQEKWCTNATVGDFVICFLMLERQSDSNRWQRLRRAINNASVPSQPIGSRTRFFFFASLRTPQPALKVDCFPKRAARLRDKLTQLQPCTGLDRFARNRQRVELVTYSTHTKHTEHRAKLQALYGTQDCVKQRQGVRRKKTREQRSSTFTTSPALWTND